MQAQYSLLCRWTEWEIRDVCVRENVALLPWSPLKGGWLTGKFTREKKSTQGTRVGWSEETGSRLQVGAAHNTHTRTHTGDRPPSDLAHRAPRALVSLPATKRSGRCWMGSEILAPSMVVCARGLCVGQTQGQCPIVCDIFGHAAAVPAGKTVAQTALRWLLQQPGVTSIVIGARTVEQLEDNMGAIGWNMNAAELAQLDDLSAVEVPCK
jgi:aryl-alcohol dehydrogenase-like predicted oxidoreductase